MGYNALLDFFPQMSLKPNPLCSDYNCQLKQKLAAAEPEDEIVMEEKKSEVVHEDNEWGISLIDETPAEKLQSNPTEILAAGLKRAYDEPIMEASNSESVEEVQTTLEDLMAKMKSI